MWETPAHGFVPRLPPPAPFPLDAVEFVDNPDCSNGITRELLPLKAINLNRMIGRQIYVEVADDPWERTQGLMCRRSIPEDTGMLFVFERPQPLHFWMFNTYAPLDIMFLDKFGNLVNFITMSPCPRPDGFNDQEWRTHCSIQAAEYRSGADALYALELPASWLEDRLSSIGETDYQLEIPDDFFVSW